MIQTEKEKLIEALNGLKVEYPIEQKFQWDIPEECPLDIPLDNVDIYSKNIYLKEKFQECLKSDATLKSHYWIIQKWGGISSFKKNENNDKRIRKFIDELNDGELTKDSFSVISSFSKIASFLEHKNYVIYDSRVIYALNWLLIKYTNEEKLFPQPSGRNKELVKYDMQTILNLSNKNYTYKTHQSAYFEYCKFIRELSSKIYEEDKPYKLEMLLFTIAPGVIVDDIKKSVKINIEGKK